MLAAVQLEGVEENLENLGDGLISESLPSRQEMPYFFPEIPRKAKFPHDSPKFLPLHLFLNGLLKTGMQ